MFRPCLFDKYQFCITISRVLHACFFEVFYSGLPQPQAVLLSWLLTTTEVKPILIEQLKKIA